MTSFTINVAFKKLISNKVNVAHFHIHFPFSRYKIYWNWSIFDRVTCSGGATYQGAPGQMTWLEDPSPWLRPDYCFASAVVWTEKKNIIIYGRFICFIL